MQATEQAKVNTNAQNPDDRKKALIGNGILLFVLVVGIILAIFAWFGSLRDQVVVNGMQFEAVDNRDVRFNTYPGTMQANGTVAYNENPSMNMDNDDFDVEGNEFVLFPGEKKYFKTIISNYDTSTYTGALVLQNTLVNANLVTKGQSVFISFGSDLGPDTPQQAYDLAAATDYSDGSSISQTWKNVNYQNIYTGIHLPAGHQGAQTFEPGVVTVYWYVVLNGNMVDNTVMGEPMMKFGNIRFD